jgi:hypothetical protein
MQKGKSQAKKPAAEKAKTAKRAQVTSAKPAKMAHRPKSQ